VVTLRRTRTATIRKTRMITILQYTQHTPSMLHARLLDSWAVDGARYGAHIHFLLCPHIHQKHRQPCPAACSIHGFNGANLCVCTCVCTCVCVCLCLHARMFVFMLMKVHMSVCVCVCVCLKDECLCAHTQACFNLSTFASISAVHANIFGSNSCIACCIWHLST